MGQVVQIAGALAIWWMFFSPSLPWGPDMTGLDGVWREDKNPKFAYVLRKDGKLLAKSEGLPLGGLVWGEFGTWKRDGGKITILPDRNWKMEALSVDRARSSFFEDSKHFPPGSAQMDSALLMRGIEHEWHACETMSCALIQSPATTAAE